MAAEKLPKGVQLQPDSSSDSDEQYDIESGLEDWYYQKSKETVRFYKTTINRFRKWMSEKFGKDLDKVKKKHIRAYIVLLTPTNSQVRPILCVLKSLFKHFLRIGIIVKDPSAPFKLAQQLPCRVERNLTSAQVREMFAKSHEKRDKTSFAILQVLVYAGLRVGACARLRCADIIKAVTDKGEHYYVRVINGKGGKSRKVPLKLEIGRSLQAYATIQSKRGVYMFPGRNPARPLSIGAVAARIKTLARKIGCPEISCHWFRHFYATTSLQNGCDLSSLSIQLGHSGVHITSKYCHAKDGESASSFIDLSTDDVAEAELTVEHHYKVKKSIKNDK